MISLGVKCMPAAGEVRARFKASAKSPHSIYGVRRRGLHGGIEHGLFGSFSSISSVRHPAADKIVCLTHPLSCMPSQKSQGTQHATQVRSVLQRCRTPGAQVQHHGITKTGLHDVGANYLINFRSFWGR